MGFLKGKQKNPKMEEGNHRKTIKTIGVLTMEDAPGMNALRSVLL